MRKTFLITAVTFIVTFLMVLASCKKEVILVYTEPVEFDYEVYGNDVILSMTTPTEDADIYFTIDGSTPTTKSTKYDSAIIFSESKTVLAFAVKNGMEPSSVSTAEVLIEAKTVETTKKIYTDIIPSEGEYIVYHMIQKYSYSKKLTDYETKSSENKTINANANINDCKIEIEGYKPSCMYYRENQIYVYYDKVKVKYTYVLRDGFTFSNNETVKTVEYYYGASTNNEDLIPNEKDGYYFMGYADKNNEPQSDYAGAVDKTYYITYKTLSDFNLNEVKTGDIVFTNGIFCSPLQKKYFKNDIPVGVVILEPADGKPGVMLCVKAKEEWHLWCLASAEGYNKEIEALYGDKTTGLIDGSNAWNIIKENCSDAETNPENYPAFKAAMEWGQKYFNDSKYDSGWYLPSVAECEAMNSNYSMLQKSLTLASANFWLTGWYYTCNQVKNNPTDIHYWNSSSNNITTIKKNNANGYAVFLHKVE